MTLNEETAKVLRFGTVLGLSIMAVGLILCSFEISDLILEAGILILIFTPVAGIAVSTKCLIKNGETYWIRIAFILIAILVIGSLVSFLT